MKTKPFVSIIIPIRRIGDYLIKENFPATDKLLYKRFETIVITSEPSKDEKMLLKKYPWLKIVLTKQEMRPAEKRNFGVKKARGEIIAFIDDDAYPSRNWLTRAIADFHYAAICGPGILPSKTNFWEKVFDEILKSWVGSGGYSYRFVKKEKRFVDDYPSMNFLIKKSVFKKLSGFNDDYWPGEDSKLCEDIVYKIRGKILYNPKILVYHHRRNNLKSFLKQHSNYGFHRGAFFAHGDQNSRRLSYIVPTFFVLYVFTCLFLFIALYLNNNLLITNYYLLITPFFIYSLLSINLFIKALINTRNLLISLVVPFVLFLTHLSYGIMFTKGFLTGLFKKERIYNETN